MNSGWTQSYLVFGQGLGVSALIATIPTLLLLFLLAGARKPAWMASLGGLCAAMVLAVGAYGMSVKHVLSAASYGASFGIFPISWIVFWALGYSGLDSMLIALVVMILGATGRIMLRNLTGPSTPRGQ